MHGCAFTFRVHDTLAGRASDVPRNSMQFTSLKWMGHLAGMRHGAAFHALGLLWVCPLGGGSRPWVQSEKAAYLRGSGPTGESQAAALAPLGGAIL